VAPHRGATDVQHAGRPVTPARRVEAPPPRKAAPIGVIAAQYRAVKPVGWTPQRVDDQGRPVRNQYQSGFQPQGALAFLKEAFVGDPTGNVFDAITLLPLKPLRIFKLPSAIKKTREAERAAARARELGRAGEEAAGIQRTQRVLSTPEDVDDHRPLPLARRALGRPQCGVARGSLSSVRP
jgi:hypothetical protein